MSAATPAVALEERVTAKMLRDEQRAIALLDSAYAAIELAVELTKPLRDLMEADVHERMASGDWVGWRDDELFAFWERTGVGSTNCRCGDIAAAVDIIDRP